MSAFTDNLLPDRCKPYSAKVKRLLAELQQQCASPLGGPGSVEFCEVMRALAYQLGYEMALRRELCE